MENEIELFELAAKAQTGDEEALSQIIALIMPAVRRNRAKIKADQQDDLEQNIVEILIRKIQTYDLTAAPDFSAFCRKLLSGHNYAEGRMLQSRESPE